MRVHSRILLQTCIFDCLLLVLQTIGHNVSQLLYVPLFHVNFQITVYDKDDEMAVLFFDGYLIRLLDRSVFTPTFLAVVWMFWFIFYNLSIFGISVQFFYRYLVLNRQAKMERFFKNRI